jgi:hypothetical protein
MPVTVTEAERTSFLRCGRQWDVAAGMRQNMRQNLEPANPPAAPDLDRAIRDALAVYYFPGMWDWDNGVRLPLVGQELDRTLEGEARDEARALLERYIRWAPSVDRFAPALVETDFEATVLDPDGAAVVTAGGEPIRYRGRIDLMAVDRHDAYWIVRHRLVDGGWPATEELIKDEEALAACWAWEQFYLGMVVTGTIYNELSRTPGRIRPWHRLGAVRRTVRQHEPSGGGRSIPQHRRMYARAREPARVKPVEQRTSPGFRRTWLRRTPGDVAAAGLRLGADVAEMARSDGFWPRPADNQEEGRLGGRSWAMGRGAAPPKFRRDRRG